MISCKVVLANNNKDESIIISPKIRRCTAEMSAYMDRNLLLRFNDGGILVVHSRILAYYSARFFDNYRLNRHHVKIKSDAHIARNLIQFHYTGILQLSFSHIEKYFLVASKLTFDIALEALSQLLEKFSHRNDYHAIICANIACEPNNHVATPCIKSIINCAASFLKQSISSDPYKTYASPNAVYRILQVLAIFTDWKKNLQLALEWLMYEEWRHLYTNSILDAIIFEASDELTKVVNEEITRLPREVGEVLAERYNHAMYRYLVNDENNVERTNPEKRSVFNTEYSTSLFVRSSPYSEVKSSLITQENVQPSTWSSETENLLLPACSSTKIFDEFLLDDGTQRIFASNTDTRLLIPVTSSTNLMSHEEIIKRQQANSSQLLTDRMNKYSQESILSHKLKNEKHSTDKLQENYSKQEVITNWKIISKIANDKHQSVQNAPESESVKSLPLNHSALSNTNELLIHFPNYENIDYSRKKEQLDFKIMRGQKIIQQKLTEKMEQLNKFGFVVDVKLPNDPITV